MLLQRGYACPYGKDGCPLLFQFRQRGVADLDSLFDAGQGGAQDVLGFHGDPEAIVERQKFHVAGGKTAGQVPLNVFPLIDCPPELEVGGIGQGALLSPDVQAPVRPDAGLEGLLRGIPAPRTRYAAGRRRSHRRSTRGLFSDRQGSRESGIPRTVGLVGPCLGLDDAVQGNANVRVVGQAPIDERLEFAVSEVTPPIDRRFVGGRRGSDRARRRGVLRFHRRAHAGNRCARFAWCCILVLGGQLQYGQVRAVGFAQASAQQGGHQRVAAIPEETHAAGWIE